MINYCIPSESPGKPGKIFTNLFKWFRKKNLEHIGAFFGAKSAGKILRGGRKLKFSARGEVLPKIQNEKEK